THVAEELAQQGASGEHRGGGFCDSYPAQGCAGRQGHDAEGWGAKVLQQHFHSCSVAVPDLARHSVNQSRIRCSRVRAWRSTRSAATTKLERSRRPLPRLERSPRSELSHG